MRKLFVFVASSAVFLVPVSAHAQIFENVGTRAQGMGGAFVAVADDATATWWNPAGLAIGAYFNALVDFQRLDARRDDVWGIAFGFPALGLSYYRLPINQMRPPSPTVATELSRQDQGALSVFGMTVGQSLGSHLVVASTLKLERSDDSSGDFDLGAMAKFGPMQLGVTVKNLLEPTLTTDSGPLTVERIGRAGVAFVGPTRGIISSLTLAFDADVTTNRTVWGDVRHITGGIEAWMYGRRLGVRAGGGGNTVGSSRGSVSGGLSVALTSGAYLKTYLEGQITRGSDPSRRGWGSSLKATF
jgi:hypothetical protein